MYNMILKFITLNCNLKLAENFLVELEIINFFPEIIFLKIGNLSVHKLLFHRIMLYQADYAKMYFNS